MKKHIVTLGTLLLSISLLGCTGNGYQVSNAGVGTVVGGIGGGVLGSSLSGGNTAATIGGTLGGAYIGNRVGQSFQSLRSICHEESIKKEIVGYWNNFINIITGSCFCSNKIHYASKKQIMEKVTVPFFALIC